MVKENKVERGLYPTDWTKVHKFSEAELKAFQDSLSDYPFNNTTEAWPSVNTSTNSRRQVPKKIPWWFVALHIIVMIVLSYIVLTITCNK